MAAAPAPAAAPPLVLDAHADTLDHVVRAVARSGFLPQAVRLMLASPDHLHDPELLYRTRGVRGARGTTLLMCVVERCDVARAAAILGACPTPAARVELLACVDVVGWAALHLACHRDRLDEEAALRLVELLLANGADLLAPARDSRGNIVEAVFHAIHYAAEWSARLVQRLVQAGASIDGDVEIDSTLFAAAGARSALGVRMIPQLVALGAHETRGNRAMLAFAQFPAVGAQPTDGEVMAALNALLGIGCSLTQPDDDGFTLMDNAAGEGNAPVARALLSLGVPVTPCSLIEGVKHPAFIRIMLAAGAPGDGVVTEHGWNYSPLMAAVSEDVLESVEALLAAGASVDRRDDSDKTALEYSIDRYSTFDPRVTEALLAAGGDINARNKAGSTLLHCLSAAQAERPWAASAARLLLQRGADVRALDNAGKTPAQRVPAAQHGGELHRLLLEAASSRYTVVYAAAL